MSDSDGQVDYEPEPAQEATKPSPSRSPSPPPPGPTAAADRPPAADTPPLPVMPSSLHRLFSAAQWKDLSPAQRQHLASTPAAPAPPDLPARVDSEASLRRLQAEKDQAWSNYDRLHQRTKGALGAFRALETKMARAKATPPPPFMSVSLLDFVRPPRQFRTVDQTNIRRAALRALSYFSTDVDQGDISLAEAQRLVRAAPSTEPADAVAGLVTALRTGEVYADDFSWPSQDGASSKPSAASSRHKRRGSPPRPDSRSVHRGRHRTSTHGSGSSSGTDGDLRRVSSPVPRGRQDDFIRSKQR